MRAVICRALGGVETLAMDDVAPPVLGPGQVRIHVQAAGVNFADSLVIAGRYQNKLVPPFIPGFEVAGTVVELAPGVETCRLGDRVMAVVDAGGFAEQVVAPADDVYVIPSAMNLETAAGFPIVYGTSHYGLKARARLRAGETLLVHGAAGGVGTTAVEVGRCIGATVIATAGGPDKVAFAQRHGANHALDYKTEDIRLRVKELTDGRGADVVYDPVGGALFETSLRCTAPLGRLLVVGFASGAVPQIPANILLVKNLSVLGFSWNACRRLDPQGVRASMTELFAWYREGLIAPPLTQTFPLDRAADAVAALTNRTAHGKLVLTVGWP